jgi:mannose-6-phosphate isomerase class I
LAKLLSAPLPGDDPIGEAWVLSDRDDHASQVANGPLKGWTLGQLLNQSPKQLLGKQAGRFRRFPLLLKFLDVHEMLSVPGTPRVLVCIAGDGQLEHEGANYAVEKGAVLLLPAVVGACAFRPRRAVSLLEIALPE